jgi:hypothetical protein
MSSDKKSTDNEPQEEVPVPEQLPAGGSAAEERLRAAEHAEGRAPARAGEVTTRRSEKEANGHSH